MSYSDLLSWISNGGYGFLPDMLSDECIAYDANNNLTLYVGTSSAMPFTPTPAQSSATNWEHSPQHTDKPPRTS